MDADLIKDMNRHLKPRSGRDARHHTHPEAFLDLTSGGQPISLPLPPILKIHNIPSSIPTPTPNSTILSTSNQNMPTKQTKLSQHFKASAPAEHSGQFISLHPEDDLENVDPSPGTTFENGTVNRKISQNC